MGRSSGCAKRPIGSTSWNQRLPWPKSEINAFLVGPLLDHEQFEEQTVYPSVFRASGDDEATAPLSRTHREIFHLISLFSRQVDELEAGGPDDADQRDLRRVLYSLHAILGLHMAQEEELYVGLAEGVA